MLIEKYFDTIMNNVIKAYTNSSRDCVYLRNCTQTN